MSDDIVETAVGPYLRYGDPRARSLRREDIAEIVRGIAVDAWTEDGELREQLATLDDESAREFFASATERSARRFR